MMRNIARCTLFCLVLAGPAAAAPPTEISGTIHADAPYGEGDAGILFVTAYKASLWTDAVPWSMTQPFALTIQYAMGFDTDELVSRTLKEIRHVDPGFGGAQKLKPELDKVFAPVKSGDRITALYVPGKPVRFYRNGAETGSIDENFAQDFFGIWLSPKTSDPSLRRHLLKRK